MVTSRPIVLDHPTPRNESSYLSLLENEIPDDLTIGHANHFDFSAKDEEKEPKGGDFGFIVSNKLAAARIYEEYDMLLEAAFSYDKVAKKAEMMRMNSLAFRAAFHACQLYAELIDNSPKERRNDHQLNLSYSRDRVKKALNHLLHPTNPEPVRHANNYNWFSSY
jgi:hypothetical protein